MKYLMRTSLGLIGLLLTTGLLISCSENEPGLVDDAQLISAIQNSGQRLPIASEELPEPSQSVITQDYFQNYINATIKAPTLGYEVSLRKEKGSEVGKRSNIYFDTKGRELIADKKSGEKDGKEDWDKDKADKENCFEFVLPVTFDMPDGAVIIVENDNGWEAIKEWYNANPDSEEKPALQYPVDISFGEDKVKTISSEEEMNEVSKYCEGDKGKECFELGYPITYMMPDGTEISVENKEDWGDLKSWYDTNPDSEEKPPLQYPVNIILADGTTSTVQDEAEMTELKKECSKAEKDKG